MKNLILPILISLFGANHVHAAGPTFEVLKNPDGSLIYLNQYDAVTRCANQGQHLPTARELAQISASMGSQGILETNYVSTTLNGVVPDGYNLITVQNTDQTGIDSFYFSNDGFKATKDFKDNLFWSISVNPDEANDMACLYGSDGGVDFGDARAFYRYYHRDRYQDGKHPYQTNTVLCVANN